MSDAKLRELEHRLTRAESELEKLRALQRGAHARPSPSRSIAGALGLLALTLMLGFTYTSRTEAQGGPRPLTVRAPFVVVDSAGRHLLSIGHKTIEGRHTLTIGDPKTGGVDIGEGGSGNGFISTEGRQGERHTHHWNGFKRRVWLLFAWSQALRSSQFRAR